MTYQEFKDAVVRYAGQRQIGEYELYFTERIRLAPRTGSQILPLRIMYPSLTAKLNCPVTGFTEPPPIFFA